MLTDEQRRVGDAQLARRRAEQQTSTDPTVVLVEIMKAKAEGWYQDRAGLLCALVQMSDQLVLARERAKDLEAGQQDLFRVCQQLTDERNALRKELESGRVVVEAQG